MSDVYTAKLMWDAYAVKAGGKTFDGKPLPTWDELGEERQSCWVAAASVTANRIEQLEDAAAHTQLTLTMYEDLHDDQRSRIKKLEAAIDDILQYVSRADWHNLEEETLETMEDGAHD